MKVFTITSLLFCVQLFDLYAQKHLPEYDSLISKLANDFKTPGVVVGIMKDYKFSEYIWGYANLESKTPITNKSVFNIASISKLVTSHAILSLVEKGKLDLDKPIESYLKRWKFGDSKYSSKTITTRMVMNHSAGLSNEFGPGFTKEDKLLSLPEILSGKSEKRKSLRIVYEPGTSTQYSNLGYGLLQLLIEDVSGEKFEDFIYKTIFKKLKMKASSFADPVEYEKRNTIVTPYNYRLSPYGQERFVASAAGGMLSNLADLEKLMLEETKHQSLLNKSSFKELHTSSATKTYGLGHMIKYLNNKPAYLGHTGLGMGWNANFKFIPDSDKGIITLTNGENGYYIHNTITCYWYYSETGKLIENCKVAPDKKLNGISYYMEVAMEEGNITKTQYEAFENRLSESRKSLKKGEFHSFVEQLSKLESDLKKVIRNPQLQINLIEAFKSCYYWMDMPWFGLK